MIKKLLEYIKSWKKPLPEDDIKCGPYQYWRCVGNTLVERRRVEYPCGKIMWEYRSSADNIW